MTLRDALERLEKVLAETSDVETFNAARRAYADIMAIGDLFALHLDVRGVQHPNGARAGAYGERIMGALRSPPLSDLVGPV